MRAESLLPWLFCTTGEVLRPRPAARNYPYGADGQQSRPLEFATKERQHKADYCDTVRNRPGQNESHNDRLSGGRQRGVGLWTNPERDDECGDSAQEYDRLPFWS